MMAAAGLLRQSGASKQGECSFKHWAHPDAALPCTPPPREEGGQRLEPFEEVSCEVADDQAGAIIEALATRRGDLLDMVPLAGERLGRLEVLQVLAAGGCWQQTCPQTATLGCTAPSK